MTREARLQMGMNAPVHLFMGQIEQESRCNEGITAFDGGMGLGQFMPETAEWIQEREPALRDLSAAKAGISIMPLPYDAKWSIRALILYDDYLYDIVACTGWYYAFRAYNGGATAMNREISRAGSCVQQAVEKVCMRRVIRLKNGNLLDLCKVNIGYPYQIVKKGENYR